MAQVQGIYWGKRLDMIAEVAAFDPAQIGIDTRACKYLVMPVGDAQWDTDWAPSKAVALVIARQMAETLQTKVYAI